ncbi:MAG: hypothetical protein JNM84_23275 [Planctomycetes bacterium]|nr:hypothetical protein [Planctomycetota bacterium]
MFHRSIVYQALFVSALAAFAHPAAGQIDITQHQPSIRFSTSRGIAGTSDGWAHNGYKFDRQGGGIGDGIYGWSTQIQDQNCATQDPLQFALFGGGADRTTGLPGLPPGTPDSWPDLSAQLAATALFVAPVGGPSACGYVFTTTLPNPLDTSALGDIFTSVFLASNVGWVADGVSSPISIVQAAAGAVGREYPIISADAQTNAEMNSEFGICWTGEGPAANPPGGVLTPGSKRYWLNRLRYLHTSRAGVLDTTGGYGPIFGAIGPQNFGMAGSYPDAINITGQPAAQPRRDELIWADQHANDFALGTGFGQVLLATRALRNLPAFGAPLPLPGIGLLELDPTDPLFNVGAIVPGLRANITVSNAQQIYTPAIPMAQAPGGVGFFLHANQVDLLAQVVRVDLATGTASLGSLDSHSFRR